MPQHSPLTYRADIDGLRAVAVSGVVAFHAFPTLAHGGFVGVDVFFVISGYLISSLILKDLERRTFSFTNFYGRRIRRIFPALIVVLAFCLGLGWLILIDDEYKMLGKHVAAGTAFVANFAFWDESGYFDTAAELKPLLHLWSLGIEEQFYIFWPALLVLIYRFRLNALVVTIVLGLISFWLNVTRVAGDRAWAFFLPQARLWELVIGGVCAYVTLHHRGSFSGLASKVVPGLSADKQVLISDGASVIGVLLICVGIFGLTKFDTFPGWWATVPVFGTALVVLTGPDALVNKTILSHRLMVFVGLISFPLYLWHWPLLVFARILRGWEPGVLARAVIVTASFALAWLTFEFVEKRIRFRSKSAIAALLVVLIGFVGLCGYLVYRFDGLPFRFKDLANISRARAEWEFTPGGGPELKPLSFSDSYFLQQKGKGIGKILFVGDSNTEQYWSRVDELIKANSTIVESVTFKTGGGCLPLPDVYSDIETHCAGLARKSVEYATQMGVDTVVFAADWWAYLEGSVRYYVLENGVKYPLKSEEGLTKALDRFRSMLFGLHKAGKQVFVVLNIPIGPEVDPRSMLHRSFLGIELKVGPPVQLSALVSRYGVFEKKLKDTALEAGAKVIEPIDYLCANNVCPIVNAGGDPIYMDATHLRPSYVRKHATFIDPVMRMK